MKFLKIAVPALIAILCYILIVNNIAREIAGTVGVICVVVILIQLAQKYIFKPKK